MDISGVNSGLTLPDVENYLAQLMRDQEVLKQWTRDIKFSHLERLLDEEISDTIMRLLPGFSVKLELPAGEGEMQKILERLPVPLNRHPKFNYVGRILGPKGVTAKQIEKLTGVKVMVRGKGSMRDPKTEEKLKADEKYKHLNDPLHVLLEVFDYPNRAEIRLNEARRLLAQIMTPPKDESEDPLKQTQLKIHEIAQGVKTTNTISPFLVLGSPLIAASASVTQSEGPPVVTQRHVTMTVPHTELPATFGSVGQPSGLLPTTSINYGVPLTDAAYLNGGYQVVSYGSEMCQARPSGLTFNQLLPAYMSVQGFPNMELGSPV